MDHEVNIHCFSGILPIVAIKIHFSNAKAVTKQVESDKA